MNTISSKEYYKLSTEERRFYTGIVKYSTGTMVYLESGLIHRLDGPARIYQDGHKEYWVNGDSYAKPEWKRHPEVILHKIKNSKKFKDVLKYKNT